MPVIVFMQSEKVVLAVGDCVQFQEEVRNTLDDLLQGQQELQGEVMKILNSESAKDAQQLLLIYQVAQFFIADIIIITSIDANFVYVYFLMPNSNN